MNPLTVVVRFDASVVRWVREQQHYTFAEERNSHAKAAVMVYRPHTFKQIEWWLLGWGDNMEVVEPQSLRERLANIAAKILLRHQNEHAVG